MKPLLKWTGGKRWLVPKLQSIWHNLPTDKLVEPFTGGMAVALGLDPKSAILNDANVHLINFYQQVRKGLVIEHDLKNDAHYYYATRDAFNALIYDKKHKTKQAAAMFYYLIRTGFNGLCRFNNSGEFNVPFGQHKSIRYRNDFGEYKSQFTNWQFKHGDFARLKLEGDELIYADPPYDVEFTKYVAKDFVWDDQVRLAHWLDRHTGPVISSNQATKRIVSLYKDLGFKVKKLPAPRMISCTGERKPATEILAFKNID